MSRYRFTACNACRTPLPEPPSWAAGTLRKSPRSPLRAYRSWSILVGPQLLCHKPGQRTVLDLLLGRPCRQVDEQDDFLAAGVAEPRRSFSARRRKKCG